MLDVVKQTWYQLADGKDPLELSIEVVATHLALKWKVSDYPYSLKYIKRSYQIKPDAQALDWDDFNALFVRGIFHYCLISAAKNLLYNSG